ncbi:MAG: AraC family transcriptional regulator [Blastocatellia bacterium]
MLITLRHNSRFSRSAETIPNAAALAKDSSYILKTRAKEYYGQTCVSHLSIKSAFRGNALFEISNGRYLPDKNTYLIINPNQQYSLTVNSRTEVEGIIIFFAAGFAEEVYRSITAPPGQLLDEPEISGAARLEFVQRLYPHDDILSPSLNALWDILDSLSGEPWWYEEQLHNIMQHLLHVHRNVYREMASLQAVRAATREEIYRRIYRARDYIAASIDQPLTLNEMARVACLSPNHFMRTFKQVFHMTPYQYLTSLRLERARQLLYQPGLTITEICFLVGFESPSYFSWLFHRNVGLSPHAYRKQKKESLS